MQACEREGPGAALAPVAPSDHTRGRTVRGGWLKAKGAQGRLRRALLSVQGHGLLLSVHLWERQIEEWTLPVP